MNEIFKFIEAAGARKMVLENPFNACHQGGGDNPPWASRSVLELRSELKRRALSHKGGKAECVKRIKEQNEWILTPAGCLDTYHRKLDLLHKQHLPNIIPFPYFHKLPPEIRLMIWEFSLPSQRILSASCGNRRNGLFTFYEKNNPYNPVLLSVCRESRALALKHYRLCFGTTNIYADLSLDILYFGDSWHHQVLGPGYDVREWGAWNKRQNRRVPAKMNDVVIADLTKIAHVAVLSRNWRSRQGAALPWKSGAMLRADAKHTFPNLKQLSLVRYHEGDPSGTPGHIVFAANSFKCWEEFRAKEFAEQGLSEEEKAKGVSTSYTRSSLQSQSSHQPKYRLILPIFHPSK